MTQSGRGSIPPLSCTTITIATTAANVTSPGALRLRPPFSSNSCCPPRCQFFCRTRFQAWPRTVTLPHCPRFAILRCLPSILDSSSNLVSLVVCSLMAFGCIGWLKWILAIFSLIQMRTCLRKCWELGTTLWSQPDFAAFDLHRKKSPKSVLK